jgi:mannitol-1-phosphate 5-dehydrogenase
MKAVIIGAGRVACGFLAPRLLDSGYEVVVVGRRPESVSAINRGPYLIDVCHPEGSKSVVRVTGARAVAIWDLKRLHEALSGARLVFTAAGAPALPYLTGPLANALLRHLDDLPADGIDVISCENMPNAVALVRQAVAEISSAEEWTEVEANVRFRRAMVWRIVSDCRLTPDGLRLRGDDFERLDVEMPQDSPPLPPIVGAVPRTRMAEAIHEKLHVFNSGHAVAGYLGYLYGYEFIHDALQDEAIVETVITALKEASSWPERVDGDRGLTRMLRGYVSRYDNTALRDSTVRVAARPVQKLSAFERLVLPAWAALTFGRTPLALADSIAAALQFDHWQDSEAVRLQGHISDVGMAQALEDICGLRATDELTQIVLARLAAQEHQLARRRRTLFARAAAR